MTIDVDVLAAFLESKHVVIIIILYGLGIYLKHSLSVKDNYIPIILTVASFVLCILYTLSSHSIPQTTKSISNMIFNIVVQSLTCVGAAVYFNQMKVQLFDKLIPKDDSGGKEKEKIDNDSEGKE